MQKFAPDFIGIGTSYAGLGKVAGWLAEHPEIANHIQPGNFFNTNAYEKKGHTWYKEKVCDERGGITGDCTPGYMTDPTVAEKIATNYPTTKLFVILRHPIYRALAEYTARRDFDARALRSDAATYISHEPSLQRFGFYGAQLEPYFSYYSPIQLYVIFYEDLANSPLTELAKLYEFLGVNPNFIPRDLKPFAPAPEEPKRRSLLKKLIQFGPRLYKKITTKPVQPIFVSDSTLQPLLAPEAWEALRIMYTPDLRILSNLLNRDMAAFWRLDDNPNEI